MFEHRPISGFLLTICLALLAGCGGADSSGSTAETSAGDGTNSTATIPVVPTALDAIAGNAQVSLTWSVSVGATSYHVKRATSNDGPYTAIATPTAGSYTDSSLTNGTTYYYVISALDAVGESADSAQTSATPDPATMTPAVPTGVTATAGNAQTALSWTASSGASGYHVKRSTTNGGPYTQVAAPTSSSYTDSSLTNGTTYYYVVSALNSAGESANSSQASATPDPTIMTPAVPTGFAATAGNAQVILSWTATGGASGYHVKRSSTSGGPYTQIAAPTSSSYTDSSVTNGTTYYYVISALNSAGESANSAQVSALPVAPASIPAVPTDLAAAPGNAQVTLNWTASSGATSYNIKRSTTSGGPYMQITAPTSTSYIDTSVTNGTTYYYVVSALGSAGESANSTQVSALPVAPTANPPPTAFGTWINVTPSNANLSAALDCGNYGTQSVQVDTTHPSNIYAEFNCQGIWKSTDYGQTWTGPINTGTNGSTAGDCAGGMAIAPTANVPTFYEACIRGAGFGFWKSVDGGVSWTNYFVAPSGSGRQDYYPPVVDPNNTNHLLMTGHEQDYLVQSTDGGQTWTSVTMANGMLENGGTAFVFFINTGNAATTSNTWLWIGQQSGGMYGTWRTTNGGSTWTQVDLNEHPHGASQIYQPDTNGVVYMAGAYSALGWGVLRSTDYGRTWAHVGSTGNETVVAGTPKNVYSGFGWAVGIGNSAGPGFELAAQPGTGAWVSPSTPSGLTQGPGQISVVNDGTHNILLGAMWNSGLWRYIEP